MNLGTDLSLLDFNAALPQENHLPEKLNSEQIKTELLNRIEDVLFYLFPNGHVRGNCFHVGSTKGEAGKSLTFHLAGERQGSWYDFAENVGGDILSLWSEARGYHKSDFSKLLSEINEWLGNPIIQRSNATHSRQNFQQNVFYDNLGKPTAKWDYLDKNGNLIACVYRYDTETGKEFRVWDVKNKKVQSPDVRPLYNIPGIASAKKIIIVEGEKSADSLIAKGFTATTAMFGANAPLDKTDWSPLNGKEVIIWPDNDEAGIEYADKLSKHLLPIALNVAILTPPKSKPAKWDAADAVLENFDIQSFLESAQETEVSSNQTISRINPISWIGTPPARQWLIDGWLPRGYVTALYGDGGVGKSLLAQQLMTCLATGTSWFDHKITQSRVYGLMCEDDENELWRRQVGINKALSLSMSDLGNICFTSRVGKNNFLMTFDGRDIGNPTPFFDELLQEIADFKADLVVLDTAADLFGGNEINRIHVRQFIQNACGAIARSINGAVLLCAHPSDSGMQRKTGTGGSTAWSNTVRSRWYLSYPDEEDANPNQRILSRKKSNYAAIGNKIDLIYQDGAFADNSVSILSERIYGKKQGKKIDAERNRRSDVILNLIEHEALSNGKVYTVNQFAEKFEGQAGLGGKEFIRKSLQTYATNSKIRFVRDVAKYNLVQPKNSSSGYMCTEGMMLKVREDVDQETGQVTPVTIPVYPSHYKHPESGITLPVEDPKIWGNKDDGGADE